MKNLKNTRDGALPSAQTPRLLEGTSSSHIHPSAPTAPWSSALCVPCSITLHDKNKFGIHIDLFYVSGSACIDLEVKRSKVKNMVTKTVTVAWLLVKSVAAAMCCCCCLGTAHRM